MGFILKGCPYPIVATPHGYLFSQKGVKQIKSDILVLLLTNPRERVMTPTFGTPLRQFVFEPTDTVLTTAIRQVIINALSQWEPRIAVNSITVTTNPDQNILIVQITFVNPTNIQDIQVLVLELPVGQGVSQ